MDPRHTRNRKHRLADIAVCGILCGCDGPTAIQRWAKHREPWLARHLALPNGIPSRDSVRRLLMSVMDRKNARRDWSVIGPPWFARGNPR